MERWTNQSRGRPMPRPRGINKKPSSQPPTRNKRIIVRSVLNRAQSSSAHMTHLSAANGRMMVRADTGPIRVSICIPYTKATLLHALHRCGRTTRNSVKRFGPVNKRRNGRERRKEKDTILLPIQVKAVTSNRMMGTAITVLCLIRLI